MFTDVQSRSTNLGASVRPHGNAKKGGRKTPATGIAGLEAPLPGLCCDFIMGWHAGLHKST